MFPVNAIKHKLGDARKRHVTLDRNSIIDNADE